jgi:hypothetical protein
VVYAAKFCVLAGDAILTTKPMTCEEIGKESDVRILRNNAVWRRVAQSLSSELEYVLALFSCLYLLFVTFSVLETGVVGGLAGLSLDSDRAVHRRLVRRCKRPDLISGLNLNFMIDKERGSRRVPAPDAGD